MSPEITIFIAKAATDKRVWIAVIATVCALLFCLASCSAFSISSLVAFSTYPSEPDDLLAVEAAYSELETQHIESLKNSEQTKPGYDEYRYITDAVRARCTCTGFLSFRGCRQVQYPIGF